MQKLTIFFRESRLEKGKNSARINGTTKNYWKNSIHTEITCAIVWMSLRYIFKYLVNIRINRDVSARPGRAREAPDCM